MNTDQIEKVLPDIAMELGVEVEEILIIDLGEQSTIDVDQHSWNKHVNEYLVFTDDEANNACVNEINSNLAYFDKGFLSEVSETDIFKYLSNVYDEVGCSDSIRNLLLRLGKLKRVQEEAMRIDGRGHFLASYDGREIEIKTDEGYIYLYRTT